jgi:stage II sporulation protein D
VLVVSGGGDGHGVGMSQYGAYGYALHGWGYQQILSHYYQGTALSTVNPDQVVRVLLETGPAAFSGANRAGGRKVKPGTTFSVQALADGQLTLTGPRGRRIATFSAPLTVTGPGPLTVPGVGSYRGALEFRPDGAGGVETINAIGLDDYVRGVVAAEMPSSWAMQGLDAQAVAARTYALTSDVGGSTYQLYPDTRSQEYGGVGAETARTDAAVAATRGQIVTYHGAPAITYFFASSGGYTEDVQNSFPGAAPEPWLRGAPDPYDGAGGDPYHHWAYRLSLPTATGDLSGLVKGSLEGIQVTRHGVSPRILTASVIGSGGRTTASGIELEQRFGLMSTWATFTTITTSSGLVAKGVLIPVIGHAVALSRLADQTAAEMTAFLRALVAARTAPFLYGAVVPASRGQTALVQKLTGNRWRAVGRARLGAQGSYAVRVPARGSYRVVFEGVAGPSVAAG